MLPLARILDAWVYAVRFVVALVLAALVFVALCILAVLPYVVVTVVVVLVLRFMGVV